MDDEIDRALHCQDLLFALSDCYLGNWGIVRHRVTYFNHKQHLDSEKNISSYAMRSLLLNCLSNTFYGIEVGQLQISKIGFRWVDNG